MSEEEAVAPEETGGKKKGGAVMAVVAAVVAASAGGFAGISFVGPRVGETLARDPAAVVAEKGDGHGDDGHGGDYGGGSGEDQLHVIENLVVNAAGTNASRFLMASVALAPGPQADVEALAARDIELRDALLRLLGTKTVPELADIARREAIKEEMMTVLSELLGEGWVKRIYLPGFFIQ